jgi:hypothetical protein
LRSAAIPFKSYPPDIVIDRFPTRSPYAKKYECGPAAAKANLLL